MKRSVFLYLWRGIKGLCPKCGAGKIFKAYLKPKQECSLCQEDFSEIHADDAPPWLTILITGHVAAPLLMHFMKTDDLPENVEIIILFSFLLLCIFMILPRAKGLFIAGIWLTQTTEEEREEQE